MTSALHHENPQSHRSNKLAKNMDENQIKAHRREEETEPVAGVPGMQLFGHRSISGDLMARRLRRSNGGRELQRGRGQAGGTCMLTGTQGS